MTAFLDLIGYDHWILHVLLVLPAARRCRWCWSAPVRAARWHRPGRRPHRVRCLGSGSGGRSIRRDRDCSSSPTCRGCREFGIGYRVGIDGISLFMVLLSVIMMPLCVLGSWRGIDTKRARLLRAPAGRSRPACSACSSRSTCSCSTCSGRCMLIPMYFLIGIWGGSNRLYAAIKFFIYTFVGSLLMLVAILVMVKTVGDGDRHVQLRLRAPARQRAGDGARGAPWLFGAFALAFADQGADLPVPHLAARRPRRGADRRLGRSWPASCSRWAPTASCGSPSRSSRRSRCQPDGRQRSWRGWRSSASSTAPWWRWCSPTSRELVAYSSVSHLGFVMLGIWGSTRAERAGRDHGDDLPRPLDRRPVLPDRHALRASPHPEIADYGGLARVVPLFATAFVITAFSSIGLPGLNGFVG